MLACAAALPATGSPLLASMLTQALDDGDHAHSAFLVADAGHLDLVLAHESHPDEAGDDAAGANPPSSLSAADHVVHIAASEPVGTARRSFPAPTPLLASAAPLLPATAVDWALRARSAPPPRGRAHLRSVVLRL
jgi:hypothetical protein